MSLKEKYSEIDFNNASEAIKTKLFFELVLQMEKIASSLKSIDEKIQKEPIRQGQQKRN